MCEAKELLKVKPVTEVAGVLLHSERTMRVLAHSILPQVSTTEPRSVFTRKFMQNLEPWVNTHPKEGKMAKRIQAYVYDNYKANIESDWVSAIGSFLGAEAPTGKFYYDVTDKFGWQAGDYGDEDACFLISRKHVLRAMEDEGGHALRYYKGNDGVKGTGRAWLMPGPGDLPIIFNAYGPSLSQFVARLQLITPGTPVSMIRLSNHDSSSGDLYINGGIGALIGSDAPDFKLEHDFRVSTSSRRTPRCAICNGRDDYGCFVYEEVDGRWTTDRYVCSNCLHSFYERDSYFSEWFPKGSLEDVGTVANLHAGPRGYTVANLVTFRTNRDYLLHMFHCYACSRCGHIATDSFIMVQDDGAASNVCYMCAADYRFQCTYCGTYSKSDEQTCQCGRSKWRNR
jgi:hypothetical protein